MYVCAASGVTRFAGVQRSDTVAPHARCVELVNPYVAGLAAISFSRLNVLSRMIWMPRPLSPAATVWLNVCTTEVIAAA